MARNERETLDFMRVESFSQLPFTRPSLAVPRPEKGRIRLFGKEFRGSSATEGDSGEGEVSKELSNDDNGDTSSRRFECHYCCRDFSTSQALGGHQNAHKRERQHAKRAHLQSLMVHGGISMNAGHDYRVKSYRSPPPLPPPQHYWRAAANRLYGSHGSYNAHHHHSQPINGSPVGSWRVPAAQAMSPFAHEHIHRQIPLINPTTEKLKQPLSTSPEESPSRFAFKSKPAMHDHLSLDLHL